MGFRRVQGYDPQISVPDDVLAQVLHCLLFKVRTYVPALACGRPLRKRVRHPMRVHLPLLL